MEGLVSASQRMGGGVKEVDEEGAIGKRHTKAARRDPILGLSAFIVVRYYIYSNPLKRYKANEWRYLNKGKRMGFILSFMVI